jgi:hypothetical protein
MLTIADMPIEGRHAPSTSGPHLFIFAMALGEDADPYWNGLRAPTPSGSNASR